MNRLDIRPIKIIYQYVLKKRWKIGVIDDDIAIINPKNNDTFVWDQPSGIWAFVEHRQVRWKRLYDQD